MNNGYTGRKGPRPHTWKVQGEIPHQQYCCWLQMKAQASFRKEEFLITFEDYQELWQGFWERKGRSSEDYCLTRLDPEGSWEKGNVECMPRRQHLKRQKEFKTQENKKWRISQKV